MIKGLYEAASGFLTEARAQEIRSNNLANVNTVGYKKDVPFFKLLVKEGAKAGETGSYDPLAPSSVVMGGTATDFSQGPLRQTGNLLDLALQGEGFFAVRIGDSEGYTRAGNFKLGENGELLDQNGLRVLAAQGELNVPEGANLVINTDGEVFADGESIGSIKLVEFDDPRLLEKVGSNIWVAKTDEAVPREAKEVELHQGFLESSNTSIIDEMVSMIDGMRRYESHQKNIRAILEDTVARTINTLPNLG
ncbi:MAG: flagellar basal-body rod protein FlgF [Candidatus Coatesbacteria bacterium]|nr:flagellar basal-body rod protein FlgF [Candidatus Coatesbacteria bacterium]